MTSHLLAAALAAGPLLAAHDAPDPCALVSAADIAAALGSRPSPGKAHGPSLDEDTGARVWSCSQGVGKLFLSIGYAEFDTPAGAAAALEETVKVAAEDDESIPLSAQSGVGDGALWGANADGAIWVVHKGKYMLNVTLAGELGDGSRYRDGLRRLAGQAIGKL